MLLHAAIQKMLAGFEAAAWIADASLAHICIGLLEESAGVDRAARSFRATLRTYFDVLKGAGDWAVNEDPAVGNEETDSVAYLCFSASSGSDIHRAARDLRLLIRQPFQAPLEIIAKGGPPKPELADTLLNWMEAVLGTAVEWKWEIENTAQTSSKT